MRWQNINRPADGLSITIDDMEGWRRNLEEAVATGTYRMVRFFELCLKNFEVEAVCFFFSLVIVGLFDKLKNAIVSRLIINIGTYVGK